MKYGGAAALIADSSRKAWSENHWEQWLELICKDSVLSRAGPANHHGRTRPSSRIRPRQDRLDSPAADPLWPIRVQSVRADESDLCQYRRAPGCRSVRTRTRPGDVVSRRPSE